MASVKYIPSGFFGLGGIRRKYADGINLDIGFFHHGFNLILSIAAAVVAAIRDDQQGLLAVVSVLHFVNAHIDGIQEGRASLRDHINQFALNVFH